MQALAKNDQPIGVSGRRLLLVAFEFGSEASPQALRWKMLTRELLALDWVIDVVTPATFAPCNEPRAGLQVHRCYPGPYHALTRRGSTGRAGKAPRRAARTSVNAAEGSSGSSALNWKGRIDRMLRNCSAHFLYPDLTRECLPFLRLRIRDLMAEHRYSAAILSHEPSLSLETRDLFAEAGIPVIAELGDPVFASYTPGRWRRRALKLESDICTHANGLVVTTERTRKLLAARHGPLPENTAVISQGFAPSSNVAHASDDLPHAVLRLVYTGRFYTFRNPRFLLEGVAATPDVELAIAGPAFPGLMEAGLLEPGNIRLMGELDHGGARQLQSTADVLVVIGNEDPDQTPGKLFEYFGESVPILYIRSNPADEGADLLHSLRRGSSVPNRTDAIQAELIRLRDLKRAGQLRTSFDLTPATVSRFSWAGLANRYSALIARVAEQGTRDDKPANHNASR